MTSLIVNKSGPLHERHRRAGRQVHHPSCADPRRVGRGGRPRTRLGARRGVSGDAALHSGAGGQGLGHRSRLRSGHPWRRVPRPPRAGGCSLHGARGQPIRLLAGLLAGQPFTSVLTGTDPLRRRPMGPSSPSRCAMGATILGRDGGKLAADNQRRQPARDQLRDAGRRARRSSPRFCWPGSSPRARRSSTSRGPYARDHTERMLAGYEVKVEVKAEGPGGGSCT